MEKLREVLRNFQTASLLPKSWRDGLTSPDGEHLSETQVWGIREREYLSCHGNHYMAL